MNHRAPNRTLALRDGTRLIVRPVAPCDRDALVAIDPSSGAIVGEARYALHSDEPSAAEVAFIVAGDWHGRGIAKALRGG